MSFKAWDKENITLEDGSVTEAICPVIISASRATDIPAFYSKWFINCLNRNYVKWINRYNNKAQYVSFSKARVIVFWSKNPQPLIQHLPALDAKGLNYYVQYTLNDYGVEGFEPNVPSLALRVETFKQLSALIGKKRVIWRFDPLILAEDVTVEKLLAKIEKVGNAVHPYTERLVFSFADIECYKTVQANLARENVKCIDFTPESMEQIAAGIQALNKNWGLTLATCAEKLDLAKYGIEHNRCIDDRLMIEAFPKDEKLMDFLGYKVDMFANPSSDYVKDKGQRTACGCMVSKDIGMYDTCPHHCVYCYANVSPESVAQNRKLFE